MSITVSVAIAGRFPSWVSSRLDSVLGWGGDMTSTEEIVVLDKNFIERRIFVCPQPRDLDDLKESAYARYD